MKIIDKYIIRTVLITTGVIALILVGLQFFITLIGEIGDIGKEHYNLLSALRYSVLMLPNNIYSFFPMLSLLSCVIGVGYLVSNNEIVVMRSSSLSLWNIMQSVCVAFFLIITIAMLIGEVIAPRATYLAKLTKATEKSKEQSLSTEDGLWIKRGNNFVRINKILSNAQLQGINQYQFDGQHHLLATSFSQAAYYLDRQWWLQETITTSFSANNTSRVKRIAWQLWSIKISKELLNAAKIEPEDMNLLQLFKLNYRTQAVEMGLQNYSLEMWKRLLRPFSSLVMVFLGMAFVFGPQRSSSLGLRIVFSISVGFIFYLLNEFIGPFSLVYAIPPFFTAIVPSLLFLMIGLLLIRRVR